jgi:hypothetical protein
MIQASRVELQIGELVLDGVAPRDRDAVAEAFTRELTRLLSEQGVPEAFGPDGDGAQVEALDAALLQPSAGLSPGHFGTRVAAAVYAGMGGTP